MLEDLTHRVAEGASGVQNDTSVNSADETYSLLRRLGASAHQLRAAARAADHFLSRETSADRDTGAWLISSAYSIADELAADLDGLARTLKDRPGESDLVRELRLLRVRAHQLHAATRAADHYLEQDSTEDRRTGSWLIAYSLGVADKLANGLDDLASNLKRISPEPTKFSDVSTSSRRAAMATALRDVKV